MINMRKEYKEELRRLSRSERQLRRDLTSHLRTLGRQTRQIQVSEKRARRDTNKQLDRIARRRGILEGRLS